MRVQTVLRELGTEIEIRPNYGYKGVRSYRVSAKKIDLTLGVRPRVTVEESVKNLVENIHHYKYTDFDNPKYYNISWMRLLEEAQDIIKVTGTVLPGE